MMTRMTPKMTDDATHIKKQEEPKEDDYPDDAAYDSDKITFKKDEPSRFMTRMTRMIPGKAKKRI
jgi:hypothetical protein